VTKLKKLKEAIKIWRNQSDISPKAKTAEIRRKLDQVQNSLNQQPMVSNLQNQENKLQKPLGE